MNHTMTVKLLGVRGTLPVHGAEFAQFGGGTSCVLVRAGGETIILDAGTVLLCNHVHRHFARSETRSLGRTGTYFQTFFNFRCNVSDRDGDGQTSFELFQGFNSVCHVICPKNRGFETRHLISKPFFI